MVEPDSTHESVATAIERVVKAGELPEAYWLLQCWADQAPSGFSDTPPATACDGRAKNTCKPAATNQHDAGQETRHRDNCRQARGQSLAEAQARGVSGRIVCRFSDRRCTISTPEGFPWPGTISGARSRRKKAVEKKKTKVWTKIIKTIMVAAKNGGMEPESNLAAAVRDRRGQYANVPRDTIERAIKKGRGRGGQPELRATCATRGMGPAGRRW